MNRERKYPDTQFYHFYNANPRNRITGDCSIRAISTATGIPYKEVVMGMAKLQCETGYDASELIGRYLKSQGWIKNKQPKHHDGTKFTGEEFCERIQCGIRDGGKKGEVDEEGVKLSYEIIANIGSHHIVAIMNGQVWDIWNSSRDCVGNYWTKE